MSSRLVCACGQTRSPTLDIELEPSNGFESGVMLALDPRTPRGSPWPKAKLYCCRGCAVVYAQTER